MPKVIAESVYTFEAVGFVANRKILNTLQAQKRPCVQDLTLAFARKLKRAGFTEVERLALEEDEGQGRKNIKVFVTFELKGPTKLSKSMREDDPSGVPLETISLLDELSQFICQSPLGTERVGAENWELTDQEAL